MRTVILQLLQTKTFGRERVPEGWIIVAAGNPPEFNKAVREFDVVTLDRLKVLNVEADYPAWKTYALEKGIHGAIMGFLDAKKDYFYQKIRRINLIIVFNAIITIYIIFFKIIVIRINWAV